LRDDFNHRGKRRDVKRLTMLIEKSLDLLDRCVRGSLEGCEAYSICVSIQHSERGVVRTDECDSAFEN
jgi:hypothetical protein